MNWERVLEERKNKGFRLRTVVNRDSLRDWMPYPQYERSLKSTLSVGRRFEAEYKREPTKVCDNVEHSYQVQVLLPGRLAWFLRLCGQFVSVRVTFGVSM